MPDVRILRLADHAGSQAQSGTNSARSPKRAGSGKSAKPAFANEKQLGQTIQQPMASGRFEYVEPDWMVYSQQAPTDAALTDGRLWGLRNSGQSGGQAGVDIGADGAWAQTLGDPSVIVGVIDTGVRYTHQDLAANMWVNPGEIPGNNIDDDNNGYIDDVHGINAITNSGDPMDDNGHGTHVAGTIAATADNGHPLVGVASGSRIMAFTPDVSPTPAERLEAALLAAGLSGPQLDPESRPFGDGLENILKYAFNLQLDRANRTLLDATDPTATSGLPVFDLTEGANGSRYLRVTFLRNVDYGLNYSAFITQDLLSSNPMNAPENVLNLGNGWQRVVIDQPIPDSELPVFGYLQVTLP